VCAVARGKCWAMVAALFFARACFVHANQHRALLVSLSCCADIAGSRNVTFPLKLATRYACACTQDVCFSSHEQRTMASVGDDAQLMLWDTRNHTAVRSPCCFCWASLLSCGCPGLGLLGLLGSVWCVVHASSCVRRALSPPRPFGPCGCECRRPVPAIRHAARVLSSQFERLHCPRLMCRRCCVAVWYAQPARRVTAHGGPCNSVQYNPQQPFWCVCACATSPSIPVLSSCSASLSVM
jgi:hypothetical protein